MAVLQNKYYSGHHRAVEERGGQGTLEGEIWKRKCAQQPSNTAGGKWMWQ